MQRPSRPTVSPEPILNLALGFMASKHLFAASEIGLFEQLALGPSTLDELAARTGVPRRTLRIVADALVALGLLDCDADHYENGAAAQAYLSGHGADDLRPLLARWDRVSYPAWRQLAASVRSGQAPTGTGQLSVDDERIVAAGVEALTAGPARALASSYDFSQHRRLLYLGSGTGAFLVSVLAEWPELGATRLELPAAAPLAGRRLDGESASTRVEVVRGDFFTEPIPGGHDVVLLANIVHRFSPERNRTLLRRTREVVTPGARLLLVDIWTDQTRTRPLAAALLAGELLVLAGEGELYREREVRGWLYTCGWQPIERTPLAGAWSLLVAEAL
jgi:hypothetical protein